MANHQFWLTYTIELSNSLRHRKKERLRKLCGFALRCGLITDLPFYFLSIFIKVPFSTIAVPRNSHMMPLAVISWCTNKQSLVIYVQSESATILDDERVILKLVSHHVGVGERSSRVFFVISSDPESDRKSVHVWDVLHTWWGSSHTQRKWQIVRITHFCHRTNLSPLLLTW